ncbi:hypothetical protein TMKG_02155, partial [Mycobacterium tuberculosis SUMu011]
MAGVAAVSAGTALTADTVAATVIPTGTTGAALPAITERDGAASGAADTAGATLKGAIGGGATVAAVPTGPTVAPYQPAGTAVTAGTAGTAGTCEEGARV